MTPPNQVSQQQNILFPLLQTMKALTGILTEEIALLQARRPQELKEFLPEKNKLMATYQKEISDLAARGGLLASGSGETIRALKQETRIFHGVLEQHTRLTKALKNVSEKMLKAISDEVVKNQNSTNTYGANGTKFSTKSATSLSLNETI